MADILEIKNVPPSPRTSLESIEIFNPLETDFTWSWQGKPYTIPSKTVMVFPEILTMHLARHLARKIVYCNFELEIAKDGKGQLTPDNAKAVPGSRVEKMGEWLLKPEGISPEGHEPPAQSMKLTESLTEKEKTVLEQYRAKVDNIAKAREAKKVVN